MAEENTAISKMAKILPYKQQRANEIGNSRLESMCLGKQNLLTFESPLNLQIDGTRFNERQVMNDQLPGTSTPKKPTSFTWLKILGIVVFASIVSTLIALFAIKVYLFPDQFSPVTLNAREEQRLEAKLDALDSLKRSPILHNSSRTSAADNGRLEPERYSEQGASREIIFTEKELNALLAKNTDLATRLAIDLSDDLASAKLLVPLDKDFPLLGGKTLKVTAGLQLAYANGRPVVIFKGVSLWGVPLPNAWLGNIKNVDLVQEFGREKGFWKAFSDGVEEIQIDEQRLRIKLKE